MKKKAAILISSVVLLSLIVFFIFHNFLLPANPKLHTIGIKKEKRLIDIYKYECEKIVFINGKDKNDKIQLFCNNVELKGYCESFEVLMLFIDENRNAIAYPLHTYYDDIEREPFYDKIIFDLPFEQELSKECVFVKRLTKNSFRIQSVETY